MNFSGKITAISGSIALVLSLGITQPAAAVDVNEYGIFPYYVQEGQAVVIAIELENCSEAPTEVSVDIVDGTYKPTLTKKSAGFSSTLENNIYTASWTYAGKKGAGVKPGYLEAVLSASGGCAAQVIADLQSYAYVQPKKVSDTLGEIQKFAFHPMKDAILAKWSSVENATKYEIWFSEAGQDNYRLAAKTSQTSFVLEADTFNLQYGTEYIGKVRPIFGKKLGEWRSTNSWRGYTSKIQAWTSLVGDPFANEVTSFESSADIQFNYQIDDCQDHDALLNTANFVHDIWDGTLTGAIGNSDIDYNDYGNLEHFTNYEWTLQGNQVLISWRLSDDLPVDSYVWGSYFIGNTGCLADGWDNIYDYPRSEYTSFSVGQDGVTSPQVDSVSWNARATTNSITFSWSDPENSADGPFTYAIYDTYFSENRQDWDLLKTTTSRKYTAKNLEPQTYKSLRVEVTNSAGTGYFYVDSESLSMYAKTGSKLNAAYFAKQYHYSKAIQKSLKITKSALHAVKNVCTVKKNVVTIGKKLGVCALTLTGSNAGEPFDSTVYVWSKK